MTLTTEALGQAVPRDEALDPLLAKDTGTGRHLGPFDV
jgi:hypothetical protein